MNGTRKDSCDRKEGNVGRNYLGFEGWTCSEPNRQSFFCRNMRFVENSVVSMAF